MLIMSKNVLVVLLIIMGAGANNEMVASVRGVGGQIRSGGEYVPIIRERIHITFLLLYQHQCFIIITIILATQHITNCRHKVVFQNLNI